ncbi:MAG: hypothetical protein ACKVOU_11855 [Cytophagales bacterium]
MKKLTISLMTLSIAALLAMNSCRNKEEAEPGLTDAELNTTSTQVSDNDNVSSSIDDALDIVNTDLAETDPNGRMEAEAASCGFTVNRTSYNSTLPGTSQKTVVYTFTNTLCNGATRTGTITATLISGNFFKDKGATYKLVFAGFGVTRNGETATLSGTQTVINVSGGLPRFVIARPSEFSTVMHKVSGDMSLTLSEAAGTRNWSIDRELTWANNAGVLSFTVNSNKSVNGYSNVVSTGINRAGYTFYTQILSPIVANSACGWYRPTSGQRRHILTETTDGSVLFTSDAVVNTGSDGCGNGFTITTTNKSGKVRSRTVTY